MNIVKKNFLKRSYHVFQSMPFEIAIYNPNGTYKYVNKEYLSDEDIAQHIMGKDDYFYAEILGISPESLDKRREKLQEVLTKKQAIRFTEKLFFLGEKKTRYIKRIFQPKFSKRNKIKEIILYGSDLTQIIHAQNELKYLVYHDKLTGLKNRQAFFEYIDQLIIEVDRSKKEDIIAILICDIDNFKKINEMVGHDIGDKFLQEAAIRIKNAIRQSDAYRRSMMQAVYQKKS